MSDRLSTAARSNASSSRSTFAAIKIATFLSDALANSGRNASSPAVNRVKRLKEPRLDALADPLGLRNLGVACLSEGFGGRDRIMLSSRHERPANP